MSFLTGFPCDLGALRVFAALLQPAAREDGQGSIMVSLVGDLIRAMPSIAEPVTTSLTQLLERCSRTSLYTRLDANGDLVPAGDFLLSQPRVLFEAVGAEKPSETFSLPCSVLLGVGTRGVVKPGLSCHHHLVFARLIAFC